MPEFSYTALHDTGKVDGHFSLGDIKDPAALVYRAEEEILKNLEQQGFALAAEEQEYLEASVAVAVAKFVPSGKVVAIGEIQVRAKERVPSSASDEYTLINIVDGKTTIQDYSHDQPVGAISSGIRRLYDLGPNDHIILYQAIDGTRQDIKPTMRVGELSSKEIYWEVKPYK